MSNFKVVFFDLDGTLTSSKFNTWMQVTEILCGAPGVTAHRFLSTRLKAGTLNMDDFLDGVMSIWQRSDDVLWSWVMSQIQIPYRDEAISVVRQLTELECAVAIVSGGPDLLVQRSAEELGVRYWYEGGSILLEEDKITGITFPADDDQQKVIQAEDFIHRAGIATLKECIFVGDGSNDVLLAKQVGLALAIHGSELARMMPTLTTIRNLTELLSYL